MRSLALYTLLALSLSACGDDGGAETTSETTNTTVTGSETTATGTEATTGDTDPGPTSEGPTTSGQTGSESSATSGTETGDTSTGDTSAGDTSTGDTSTGDTGSTTDDTTGGTTGGATSDLVIAIVDAELSAFCMPEVEPDPVHGSWYVEFDNSNNAASTSATLIKASLSLLDADPPVLEEIEASPKTSGLLDPGDYASVKLEKLTGEAHSACEHCDEFYLLELDYQEGDVIHHVTEEVTIPCSF